MNQKLAWLFLLLCIATGALLAGCTSKRAIAQREQAAYLAGQNAALQKQEQTPGVTILGPVQYSHVPWVAGLTLGQAIATANYQDSHEPKEIVITRNGESATVDPKALLNGRDVPLESGDIIEIRTEK